MLKLPIVSDGTLVTNVVGLGKLYGMTLNSSFSK